MQVLVACVRHFLRSRHVGRWERTTGRRLVGILLGQPLGRHILGHKLGQQPFHILACRLEEQLAYILACRLGQHPFHILAYRLEQQLAYILACMGGLLRHHILEHTLGRPLGRPSFRKMGRTGQLGRTALVGHTVEHTWLLVRMRKQASAPVAW